MSKNTAEIKSMVVMAQARKVPVKKAKIRTFGVFGQFLWKKFKYFGNECEKVDIIFDLYLDSSMSEIRSNQCYNKSLRTTSSS